MIGLCFETIVSMERCLFKTVPLHWPNAQEHVKLVLESGHVWGRPRDAERNSGSLGKGNFFANDAINPVHASKELIVAGSH